VEVEKEREREREDKNWFVDQREREASAEGKETSGRRKTEGKKEWNSPRTYT
jgi:hypothetical protein